MAPKQKDVTAQEERESRTNNNKDKFTTSTGKTQITEIDKDDVRTQVCHLIKQELLDDKRPQTVIYYNRQAGQFMAGDNVQECIRLGIPGTWTNKSMRIRDFRKCVYWRLTVL